MSIADLPEDLIEYILLQLNPYGDIQNAGRVSRKWNRVARGARGRLVKLLKRCESLDWFLLMQAPQPNGKFQAIVAERCSHAAAYLPDDEAVFVFGGCTASYTTFNDLWKLDLRTRSWIRPIPSGDFPSPKACATLVEFQGSLVLFGGWSKSSPNPIHQTAMFFNELHIYCTKTNTWSSLGTTAVAPHLAGHSATIMGNRMVVFGGSHGNGSTNSVWVFDMTTHEWSSPPTSTQKPLPRYGQSQINIDDRHLLILGGCGGPNLIFSDVWLLSIGEGPDDPWNWTEISVTNPSLTPPQIWSHPACKLGEKVIVLSRALRGLPGRKGSCHRAMSSSRPQGGSEEQLKRSQGWVPPQGNLIPPRRKLITSRSLDEENPPPSPCSDIKKPLELQRAQSIPAIIVGEIPKLVVTKEENSGDSSGSDSSTGPTDEAPSPSTCIALIGSSLIPNQAVLTHPPPPVPSGGNGSKASPPAKKERVNVVRPGKNREKQLQMLRRMEDYIRSKSRSEHASGASSGTESSTPSGSPTLRFPPSSPPPRSKHSRAADFLQSKNPMSVYILDTEKVLSEKMASWFILEESMEAPEDTILYSLVKGRGELIMFGGMKSGNPSEQQGLDVTPFSRAITNETYILKPTITL